MGTQLILTVGTNPLPVWVAWYHLKDKLQKPIKVRLVHTKDTVDERDRLKKYCQGADFLDPIQTSAGNPGTVRRDISVILNDLNEINNLHVHYTGGTKVMAVETVAGIEYDLPEDIDLDTSYLDPRTNSGPAIVNSSGRILVRDTRKGICANLKHIASLNGFKLGPFRHRWGRGPSDYRDCLAAEEPQDEQLNCGEDWLDQGWAPLSKPRMLECGACAAFKQTLNDVCQNPNRSNYKIFRSVFVRRQDASDWDKNFELDVVAVLGYQIVVVSCTVDRNQDMIKKKGMEAILRARQLGGDEARAIVLCSAVKNVTDGIQRELHDEIGSPTPPLEIWGRTTRNNLPNMQALSAKFAAYLKDDLKWQ